ncbi:hypothetical protein BD408DRAFT_418679 [Parasitella parasitica]|nr:hypothetical protein BD408DRAFT_418679 [Parasitella parasitica]
MKTRIGFCTGLAIVLSNISLLHSITMLVLCFRNRHRIRLLTSRQTGSTVLEPRCPKK